MDAWRTETLRGYSGMRRYTLTCGSSGPATMLVKVEYSYPENKSFQVVSQKNCGVLHQEVFHRIIDTEIQAARENIRQSTRIIPRNYDFEFLTTEDLKGRNCYVIRIVPKHKHRFLVNGNIWVDTKDTAVTRIDGEAITGSFWIRESHLVQSSEKVGSYWLPASSRTDATVRFMGHARMDIEYFDYQLRS